MWCGLGTCTKTAAKKLEVVQIMLLVQLWNTLPIISNCIENPIGLRTLEKRWELHTATWVYRRLKPGLSPPYLHDLFQPIQKQYQHHTQLSKNGIIIPRAHMNMMSWSFRYKGAVVWNSLPDDIKCVNRGSTFSHALKLFYASSCKYCTILAYCF